MTGEDQEVQISWDQDMKGEVLKWRSQCMTEEDKGVQISGDQDLMTIEDLP